MSHDPQPRPLLVANSVLVIGLCCFISLDIAAVGGASSAGNGAALLLFLPFVAFFVYLAYIQYAATFKKCREDAQALAALFLMGGLLLFVGQAVVAFFAWRSTATTWQDAVALGAAAIIPLYLFFCARLNMQWGVTTFGSERADGRRPRWQITLRETFLLVTFASLLLGAAAWGKQVSMQLVPHASQMGTHQAP